jgi:hypothetical protein
MDDGLSELARRVLKLGNQDAYAKLVVDGDGNGEVKKLLAGVGPEEIVAGKLERRDEGMCLIAGLYLWHDCLNEAHAIAQGVPSATGSFWHAIMHRREGDFSNSKYWYARCANHPAYPFIAAQVNSIVASLAADKGMLRLTHGGWRPEAFVDWVEVMHQRSGDSKYQVAVEVQRAEWRGLFEWCAREAGR